MIDNDKYYIEYTLTDDSGESITLNKGVGLDTDGTILKNWIAERNTTLKTIKISTTNTITNCYKLFYYCSSLISLDLSNFDTSNVINMYAMFYGCSSLTSLNLGNFNTQSLTNYNDMFSNTPKLTSVYFYQPKSEVELKTGYSWGLTENQMVFDYNPIKAELTPDGKFKIVGELIEGTTTQLTTDGNLEAIEFIEVKEVEEPMFRNIQVGDDLLNKTLYLSFPDNLHERLSTSPSDIIGMYGCSIDTYPLTNKNIVVMYNGGQYIDELYSYNGSSVTTNLTEYIGRTLEPSMGVVTSIDNTNPAYEYIKIADGITTTVVSVDDFNILPDGTIEAVEFIEL